MSRPSLLSVFSTAPSSSEAFILTCRNGQWAECTTDACLPKATCLKSHKQYNGIPLMRTMSMPTQSPTCQMVPFQGLPSGQLQGVSGNLEHWQGVTAGAALRIQQQACVLIARTGCQGVDFACVRITYQVSSSRATEAKTSNGIQCSSFTGPGSGGCPGSKLASVGHTAHKLNASAITRNRIYCALEAMSTIFSDGASAGGSVTLLTLH